jgi:leucyl-tRNA synthetase
MEEYSFNTATARLIELNNALVGRERVPQVVAEALVVMLSPQAPHVCEELWQRLGHPESLAREPWPAWDESRLVRDTVDIVVQVMGKKRGLIAAPAEADREAVEALALADPAVQRHLEGRDVRKVIYVPGKLVNIVTS